MLSQLRTDLSGIINNHSYVQVSVSFCLGALMPWCFDAAIAMQAYASST
jgi:hypothetical protein